MVPAMGKRWHRIGFTGHRLIASPSLFQEALGRLLDQLAREFLGRPRFISSVASGSDLLFAQTVTARGWQWKAILPRPAESFRSDFAPDDWDTANAVLEIAALVQTVSATDSFEEGFRRCGQEIVKQSDCLIAFWDGQKARGPGGTQEVVAFALRQAKPVIRIDALTLQVSRLGEST